MSEESPLSGNARRVTPADRWEIVGYDRDDVTAASLVLTNDETGQSLSLPFDPDLLSAVGLVADAWGIRYGSSDYPDEDYEDYEEDDDEPTRRGAVGNVSRMTGWHQVSALMDTMPPERRTTVIATIIIVVILTVVLTQML